MTVKRRRLSAEFKLQVALEAIRGKQTLRAIAARHEVHPSQVSAWKRLAINGLDKAFEKDMPKRVSEQDRKVKELRAKLHQLTLERDFLRNAVERSKTLN